MIDIDRWGLYGMAMRRIANRVMIVLMHSLILVLAGCSDEDTKEKEETPVATGRTVTKEELKSLLDPMIRLIEEASKSLQDLDSKEGADRAAEKASGYFEQLSGLAKKARESGVVSEKSSESIRKEHQDRFREGVIVLRRHLFLASKYLTSEAWQNRTHEVLNDLKTIGDGLGLDTGFIGVRPREAKGDEPGIRPKKVKPPG